MVIFHSYISFQRVYIITTLESTHDGPSMIRWSVLQVRFSSAISLRTCHPISLHTCHAILLSPFQLVRLHHRTSSIWVLWIPHVPGERSCWLSPCELNHHVNSFCSVLLKNPWFLDCQKLLLHLPRRSWRTPCVKSRFGLGMAGSEPPFFGEGFMVLARTPKRGVSRCWSWRFQSQRSGRSPGFQSEVTPHQRVVT